MSRGILLLIVNASFRFLVAPSSSTCSLVNFSSSWCLYSRHSSCTYTTYKYVDRDFDHHRLPGPQDELECILIEGTPSLVVDVFLHIANRLQVLVTHPVWKERLIHCGIAKLNLAFC